MNNEMIIYKEINYLKTFDLLNISYLMGIGKLAFLKKKQRDTEGINITQSKFYITVHFKKL